MQSSVIYDFFNFLKEDNLSFLYNGFFNDEFTDKIISISEKNIEKNEDSLTIKNRVSFLIAESFQNIVRHTSADELCEYSDMKGIFILRNIGSKYFISSVNVIKSIYRQDITDKLMQINELDSEQLKELYIEIMNNQTFSDKGGAGLGLIQMARKSGNKLEFDFEIIDDKNMFFYLQMQLTSKKEGETFKVSLSESRVFLDYMHRNNTKMVYKGDFSQENVISILKIIEKNLYFNAHEYNLASSGIHLILTELLQNISKHGLAINNKKEGIFMIGKHSGNFIISAGNYIEQPQVEKIQNRIIQINNLNEKELKSLYLNNLKDGYLDKDGNAGLGLIEISRLSSEKLSYIVTPLPENKCFFTISVVL
ncbi:MAG: SiaB family protein kinase [Bacteroidales bacterium]